MMFTFSFGKKEKDDLVLEIPKHIAIIMDGNGRWAKKRMQPRVMGHKAGMDALQKVTKAASEMGVKVLTVYAFSTENWTRPENMTPIPLVAARRMEIMPSMIPLLYSMLWSPKSPL